MATQSDLCGRIVFMSIIDLSVTLNSDTPVYPGDPTVEITVAAEIESAGYLDHVLTLGTHNGTHIDAEAHMVSSGKMLADYPVEQFIGDGVLIDARSGLDVECLVGQDLSPKDIVLLWTGISDFLHSDDYYRKVPHITDEAARYLVSKGVKLVAVDAGSIDSTPFPIHKILLAGGVLIAENLVGFSKLIDTSFEVWALPLKLEVEAAPARIVARILG
jgi:arylformamidase